MGRSLIKQCNDALDRVTKIGWSRHEGKKRGDTERWIYSYHSRDTYGGHACHFIHWLRERRPDLHQLRDITPDDVRAYIHDGEEHGLAGGTLRSRIAALRKLEAGMKELRWIDQSATLVPTDLRTTTRRSVPRLGFSWDESERLITHLDGDVQLVARLARDAGLRLDEAVRLRCADLRPDGIWVNNGKGGRSRLVTHLHDPALLDHLPHDRNYVFADPDGLYGRVEKEIAQARRDLDIAGDGRNVHALRATYAERYVRDAIDKGTTERAARERLTLHLGHNRASVTYRYVPRLTPREQRKHVAKS